MTTKINMTKEQILNVNKEQAKRIRENVATIKEQVQKLKRNGEEIVHLHEEKSVLAEENETLRSVLANHAERVSQLAAEKIQLQNALAAERRAKTPEDRIDQLLTRMRWLEDKLKHHDADIDGMMREPAVNPVDEKLKAMDARITWYVNRIGTLENRIKALEEWRNA